MFTDERMKYLSICVPTYSRSAKLLVLMKFLYNEYLSLSDEEKEECEFIIRDNASTDSTSEVALEFLAKYPFATFNKNETNIGLVPNFCKLTKEALGQYVWWVGDDDEFTTGVIRKLLNSIKSYKPSLVYINHCAHFTKNGKIDYVSALNPESSEYYKDGKQAIADIINYSTTGAVLFMTSKVVRRDLLLEVLDDTEYINGAIPLFVAFYAASKGSVSIIKDIMIDNIYGEISWSDIADLIHYKQIPDVIHRLKSLGYTKEQRKVIEKDYLTPDCRMQILKYKLATKSPFCFRIIQSIKRSLHR